MQNLEVVSMTGDLGNQGWMGVLLFWVTIKQPLLFTSLGKSKYY